MPQHITATDVVETTHRDHASTPPRIERWTVGTAHDVTCEGHAGLWLSYWTAETFLSGYRPRDPADCTADLHRGGYLIGTCDQLPHGGSWWFADDVHLVASTPATPGPTLRPGDLVLVTRWTGNQPPRRWEETLTVLDVGERDTKVRSETGRERLVDTRWLAWTARRPLDPTPPGPPAVGDQLSLFDLLETAP